MSPATLAIIPLVIVAVGVIVGLFKYFNETEDVPEALGFTFLSAFILGFVTWALLYCLGVVYFDSWEF